MAEFLATEEGKALAAKDEEMDLEQSDMGEDSEMQATRPINQSKHFKN